MNIKHKDFENIKNSLCALTIQKVYQGYYYRKYILPDLVEELKNKVDKMLKEFYTNYLTVSLKKQESSIGIKHNENSYKSLYSSENSIGIGTSFIGGLRLSTKLLILKYKNVQAFYVGEVNIDNKLNGRGILTLKNGAKYNGTFDNGNFTGVGRYIDSEGTLYEGYFTNGKLDGRATKKTLSGSLYIGDFVSGIREGQGKEETIDHIYEGKFSNDMKNGKGKVTYKTLNDFL